MKGKAIILITIFTFFSTGCGNNKTENNNQKKEESNLKVINASGNKILKENDSALGYFDSLAKVKVDTTSLSGKRLYLMNRFIVDEYNQPMYDTLFDLTYDGFKDYVIGYYGKSGTGLKNKIRVYFYNPKLNSYTFNKELSDLPNVTFYIKQKKITGFYIGNGGGRGKKLEWVKNKWVVTKKFEVDGEGDKTKWKINYPEKKKNEVKIKPFQMVPPQDILETSINY